MGSFTRLSAQATTEATWEVGAARVGGGTGRRPRLEGT